ncbi:MAG: ABC transporter permease [Spirochaetes bacterium]|nr:ABC transporter permease [Spirochaetota bacterium]
MKLDSFIRIVVIAEKEWIQIRRDIRSLILALILPVLLLLLFGYALNMDVKNVTVGVYDQDRSVLSRLIIEKISATEYIKVTRHLRSFGEIDRAIDESEIIMAIVFPPQLYKNFMVNRPCKVQLIVDGSDPTSALVAMGYVRSMLFDINHDILKSKLNRFGLKNIEIPVEVRTRVWYNETLESKNFIVPGLLALIMAIISALIASLTMSREWERGTMESLIATPLRPHELFMGKLLPYVFIALFDLVITLFIGAVVFHVPIRGNALELYVAALLFLVGTCGVGILISSATKVQVLSIQLAMMITYLPSLILSGFVFPIKNMPLLVQCVTYFVPARYLIAVMKSIALKGVGYTLLWVQIAFLFAFACIVTVAGLRKASLNAVG